MNNTQDIQGSFLQPPHSQDHCNGLVFGFREAKGPCTVFASAYNEDAHMTRIYSCRPIQEQADVWQDYINTL